MEHILRVAPLAGLLFVSFAPGCTWDEELVIENLQGKVYIPEAAATRELLREDGSIDVVTDVGLIGPVYLGLFASVYGADAIEAYPHPEVGPQYIEGTPGDTYPYGGTTIGDLRYACFGEFTCKVVSGRFVSFDDLVTWWNDTLGEQIVDSLDRPVTSGEFVRQTCYALLDVATDEEVMITVSEDKDGNGKLDEMDLDFVYDGDGYYVGDFTIYQQEWFDGFSLWGFMDSPSDVSYRFGTCDPENGVQENEYSATFFGGRPHVDVLNQPAKYIEATDWVSEGLVWEKPFDVPELYMNFEVQ